MIRTVRLPLIGSSTTNTRCWMPATWCSSTRPARALAICAERTRKRRFSASIRMRTPLRISSSSSCRGTTAGIRRSICSAKAMAPPARPRWPSILENEKSLDLNGVILLSQILNFDNSVGWAAVQSGRGSALCAGVADLYRNRVVSPQAAESAGRAGTAAAGSGEFRHDRLHAGACRRLDLERRAQGGDRRASCTITPVCRPITSSAPICASTAASSRRRCWARKSPPAGWTPDLPGRPSIR